MNKSLADFAILVSIAGAFFLSACSQNLTKTNSGRTLSVDQCALHVGIAPYADLSILTNAQPLGLEKKYGTKLELLTMPWEDLIPAVASAGRTIDVTFASLSDYLAKEEPLNRKESDPILFIYPTWNFHGGGLITFNRAVPEINAQNVNNPDVIKKFFTFKLGAQKYSCFHMLLWDLASRAGIKLSALSIMDTTVNDGLLAAENGDLDIASAGQSQQVEGLRRRGRIVLTMDTLGLIDMAGFICKESFYREHRREIIALIKMWFDCVNYAFTDLDHHSDTMLAYLNANSSTHFTVDELKAILAREYFPRNAREVESEMVSKRGKCSIEQATLLCNQYLIDTGAIKYAMPVPKIMSLDEQ